MSLSALEEKLKPEVLATFEEIEQLYKKLHKMQHRRLESMTSGEEVNARSEKSYEKQREELVHNVEQVRLHNNRIEELVTQLKQLNQRLTALEGQLMRMAGRQQDQPRGVPQALSRLRARPQLDRPCRQPAGQGLEAVRLAAFRGRSSASARRSPPSRPTPACRSPSSAAST